MQVSQSEGFLTCYKNKILMINISLPFVGCSCQDSTTPKDSSTDSEEREGTASIVEPITVSDVPDIVNPFALYQKEKQAKFNQFCSQQGQDTFALTRTFHRLSVLGSYNSIRQFRHSCMDTSADVYQYIRNKDSPCSTKHRKKNILYELRVFCRRFLFS